MHINVIDERLPKHGDLPLALIKCQRLKFFVPSWRTLVIPPIVPLISFGETTNSISCPTMGLHIPCAVDILVVFNRHFYLTFARLKLKFGSCRFTRC